MQKNNIALGLEARASEARLLLALKNTKGQSGCNFKFPAVMDWDIYFVQNILTFQ